ncbi:MAG: hypothetical protein D6755_05120 [Anaerolineae bacterium]|nr:MAG: hypothetical protein D6755_05120 [Anaerolineae bacterium]
MLWDWLVAGILGALVGLGGIISRYRDEPFYVLRTIPALFYMLLNAAVSAFALYLAHVFQWDFGMSTPESIRWMQVLGAGFGAMLLIRSSFLTVRVNEEDIHIGPYSLLQSIFDAIDREVDRVRAEARASSVSRIMAHVSFQKAYMTLPAYAFALLQNLDDEAQKEFGKLVETIYKTPIDDRTKALLLGAQLLNLVGEDVLESAVKGLGKHIEADSEDAQLPEEDS